MPNYIQVAEYLAETIPGVTRSAEKVLTNLTKFALVDPAAHEPAVRAFGSSGNPLALINWGTTARKALLAPDALSLDMKMIANQIALHARAGAEAWLREEPGNAFTKFLHDLSIDKVAAAVNGRFGAGLSEVAERRLGDVIRDTKGKRAFTRVDADNLWEQHNGDFRRPPIDPMMPHHASRVVHLADGRKALAAELPWPPQGG